MDPRARFMVGDVEMTEPERLPPPRVGRRYRTDNPNPFADEPPGDPFADDRHANPFFDESSEDPFIDVPPDYGNPNALIHRDLAANRPTAYRSARENATALRYMDPEYLDAMVRRLWRASGDFDRGAGR